MPIRVYNTLQKKKETFEPITSGKVRIYVCGPTVYDSCHIGHARSVVVFDVITRYFEAQGYDVTYVRNFTDIDDKIINRARELNIETTALAEKYIDEFYTDMDALNVKRATIEPKATEHIDQIIGIVEKLIAQNNAYEVDGDVYFAVESFADYGRLSGRRLEDMEAGARIDVDKRKKNPFDFALWKKAKPGEPFWESPWGQGRPGWHIECSAMSSNYLGQTFDIHGGGKDLIFPHHENEIAQSEAASGHPFAKYWLHNGFVNIDQEKMSKSLGNFLMIKDVLQSYHPEAVRLFLLSNHYRSPIDYSTRAITEAEAGLDKLYAALQRAAEVAQLPAESDVPPGDTWARFCEAMNDDFNTARGIGVLFEAVREMNRMLDMAAKTGKAIRDADKHRLAVIRADLKNAGSVLGIFNLEPADYFGRKQDDALKRQQIDPAQIDQLVEQRTAARNAKDWDTADRIRKQLDEMNVVIEDRPDGTVWKILS